MKKALFLDRDGVINIDKSYVYKIEDFVFCDGVFEVLRYFQGIGYLLIVITNQSGIGRGYYTSDEYQKLNNYMLEQLQKNDVQIEKVFHCPHDPDKACECRKPSPKMVLEAAKEFDIDLKESIFVGDKITDMQCAKAAKVGKKYLIGSSSEFECIENLKDLLGRVR